MACDKHAGDTTEEALGGCTEKADRVLAPPYAGARAMLKIKERWITSKMGLELQRARRGEQARIYIKGRYKWDKEGMAAVYWEGVGRVRRKMSRQEQVRTMKIMHGWLPVRHMLSHVEGTAQCPGCAHRDETVRHFLRCPHKKAVKASKERMVALEKAGRRKGIPRGIWEAICRLVKIEMEGKTASILDITEEEGSPEGKAVAQQMKIGVDMMQRGYLARGWYEAMKEQGTEKPERKIGAILKAIWDEWVLPLWVVRNSIAHEKDNEYDAREDERMMSRIRWYTAHSRELLAHQDWFLGRVDLTKLAGMHKRTKKRWIENFE